jgi:hypothetical protein
MPRHRGSPPVPPRRSFQPGPLRLRPSAAGCTGGTGQGKPGPLPAFDLDADGLFADPLGNGRPRTRRPIPTRSSLPRGETTGHDTAAAVPPSPASTPQAAPAPPARSPFPHSGADDALATASWPRDRADGARSRWRPGDTAADRRDRLAPAAAAASAGTPPGAACRRQL